MTELVKPPPPMEARPFPGTRDIFEVRFHGRGGQGTVVASILLAEAAFREGRGVQAFPFFGVERRGAPVVAHTRMGAHAVRIACEVATPDAVVVMDPTLVGGLGTRLIAGLRAGGTILINTRAAPADVHLPHESIKVATVDATGIARRHTLGSVASPIVNTAMLGAFVAVSRAVSAKGLEETIREKAPARAEANVAAAIDGAKEVRSA
jgi:2-oxoacid:acceptor oxidoreductase gamma subunit (pyruvate/2-ketoisovalerate family)